MVHDRKENEELNTTFKRV